ncbi:MAG: LysM peptidoglycan-binding domain-containing protein [Deltaproteobacteria bacterium]|nr:LysM peptidoglycan-binding domain-containing protein [Deltaproteobacteria bacterium]
MGRTESCFRLNLPPVCILVLTLLTTLYLPASAKAITASVGQPYHGRLINGVPFPEQFEGYQVRDEARSYATPELIGALLDALDVVRKQDPETCDLFIGDFSREGGGALNNHRSHQNGRDVDLGMFLKGNREVSTFLPMNGENLDVPKTWALIEGLLRSQRVQYIFVDRKIQNLLYDYALCRGVDPNYLDQLFGGTRHSIIQHVRNHHDHIHVRFYAPWSTMAAQLNEGDEQKRTIIEMAQQAYLPKKVNYYVKGTEPSLDALAQSFGVNRKDLTRWNQTHGNDPLKPGSCLVFYKRGFEIEPVRLAQSLAPGSVPETPAVQLASLRSLRSVSDAPVSIRNPRYTDKQGRQPAFTFVKVRKGETLKSLAKKHKVDLYALAELNGLKRNAALKPGQKLKIATPGSHIILDGDGAYAVTARTCDPRTVTLKGQKAFAESNLQSLERGNQPDAKIQLARLSLANHRDKSPVSATDAGKSRTGRETTGKVKETLNLKSTKAKSIQVASTASTKKKALKEINPRSASKKTKPATKIAVTEPKSKTISKPPANAVKVSSSPQKADKGSLANASKSASKPASQNTGKDGRAQIAKKAN